MLMKEMLWRVKVLIEGMNIMRINCIRLNKIIGNDIMMVINQIIMKWIALKLKNLPIISLEIERALQVFQTMANKYNSHKKREEFIQISQLANEFKKRIGQLDVFYKEHHLEDNISIFHMLKIKLQKALFKINQLTNQKSINQQSFKDDSLSLFPQNQIKLLEQPLFRYYQSPTRKVTKEDYLQFAKNAPKQEMSSFGQKGKLGSSSNQVGSSVRPEQQKNQFSKTNNQLIKNKAFEKETLIQKPNVPNKNNAIKKNEKKVSVAYKTAAFTPNQLQKAEQQKLKQHKKGNSPQQQSKILQSNFLQALNNQNQLKFTIKMTKEQYRQLLEMKKKISEKG